MRLFLLPCLLLGSMIIGCSPPAPGKPSTPEAAGPADTQAQESPDAVAALAALREIEASGAPLDAGQWQTFYRLPANLPDRTDIVLDAIAEAPGLAVLREEFGMSPFMGFGMPLDKVPPPGEQWEELANAQELVSRHSAVLKQLHKALEQPCAIRFPTDPRAYPNTRPQHHSQYNAALRLLRADMAVKGHGGDSPAALATLVAMIRLEGAWLTVPDAEQMNFALTNWELLAQAVGWYLSYGNGTEQDLQLLTAEVKRIDLEQATERAVIGTRALVIDVFRRGDLAAAEYQNSLFLLAKNLDLPAGSDWVKVRSRDVLEVLATFTKAAHAAKVGFPAALPEYDEIKLEMDNVKLQPAETRNNLQPLFGREAETTLRWCQVLGAFQQTSLVGIATTRYRLRHKMLPDQLTDLVPNYLSAIPLDPYVVDQPLQYRQDGVSFVVYSCYSNRADDEGKIRGTPAKDIGVYVRGTVVEPQSDGENTKAE